MSTIDLDFEAIINAGHQSADRSLRRSVDTAAKNTLAARHPINIDAGGLKCTTGHSLHNHGSRPVSPDAPSVSTTRHSVEADSGCLRCSLADHLAHEMHGRGLIRATHCSLFQASNGSRNAKFVRERNKEPVIRLLFCSARLATAIWAMHGRRARYGRQRYWSVHAELQLAGLS